MVLLQLVDEFIEEEREESNDPLEGDPKGGGTQQDEPELQDDNEEMEVKEEDVEEVVGAEELKEDEDLEEVKDEDVEELDDNQECRDYEADGEGGDMGMGEDDEAKQEVKQEDEEEERVSQKRVIKRKQEEVESNAPVRKSSRLRTKLVEDPQQTPADTPRKKMLQKPGERPSKVEEETEEEEEEAEEEREEKTVKDGGGDDGDGRLGDPSREPGADAQRRLDPDLLLPFRLGWTRECVFREFKTGPKQIEIYYYPPKNQVLDPGARKKEAIRRRRSKMDQERFFEEFPHPKLSVCNFSYVRRPLGLNNEAYELVRETKSGLETRATRATDKMRESKKSYREVAEHEGLLSSGSGSDGEEEDDEVQDITEFDVGLPLSLQVDCKVTPLREEHKKRRRWPDRERCLTPPLAEDLAWTALDDDPMGVFTKLFDEQVADRLKCPATPPPLRALRLTRSETAEEALKRQSAIRDALPDPLDRIIAANKELRGAENLASHDLAVRKFKNYRPPQALGQARPPPTVRKPLVGFGNNGKPQGPNSRPPPSPLQGYVKVRLPMPSTNGKRPVVELVMLTNGKYQVSPNFRFMLKCFTSFPQPIKFTNNRQVTESIPKRLFDQANMMKKTLYQRSMQVYVDPNCFFF